MPTPQTCNSMLKYATRHPKHRSDFSLPRHFVWTHDIGQGVHGGSKATLDSYEIARRAGWTDFDTTLRGRGLRRLISAGAQLAKALRAARDSTFLVQLPAYGLANIVFANIFIRIFNSTIILHDIDELKGFSKIFKSEKLCKHSNHIIFTGKLSNFSSPNPSGDGKPRNLEMWDYLVDAKFSPPQWCPEGPILFAGNLAPDTVAWLYRRDVNRPPLILYGNRCDRSALDHTKDLYVGPFLPDSPKFEHAFGWGLVWTGAKTGSEQLSFDYEMICQSHKFSLDVTP